MSNAAATIETQLQESIAQQEREREAAYWQAVRDAAQREHDRIDKRTGRAAPGGPKLSDADARQVAEAVSRAGRDAAQFSKDVKHVQQRVADAEAIREEEARYLRIYELKLAASELKPRDFPSDAEYLAKMWEFEREIADLHEKIGVAVMGRIRLIRDCPYPWLLARRQHLDIQLQRADAKLKQREDGVLHVKGVLRLRHEALERAPAVGNMGDQRSRPAKLEAIKEAEAELDRAEELLEAATSERAATLARSEALDAEMLQP
jgi:hypothetical protein